MGALNEEISFAGQPARRAITSAGAVPRGVLRAPAAALKLVSGAQNLKDPAESSTLRNDLTVTPATAPFVIAPDAQSAQRTARDTLLAKLLTRAAKGDQQAFAEFYDATVGYAQALARRMLSAADLEDVLAEAYLQVWRKAGSFDAERGSPVTWLLLIVRSRALDLLRKPHEEHLDADTPEVADDDAGPPDLLETTQANAALHAALAQLGAKERWALSLAYYRDMSHAQIAVQTGMPLGTVKSLINRAQEKLRALLA